MTDAELAILSIIAEGPIHGYDIQTVVEQRGLRAWTNIGVSSLYYVLEKLERQGLIESKNTQHTESAARRQYSILSAGFGVLQTAVASLLSTSQEYANSFELGLANLHVLRPEQVHTALITYQQALNSRRTQVNERWRILQQGAPFHIKALFDHHLAMLDAELTWIKDFIAEWETQIPPETPASAEVAAVEIPRKKQVVLPHDPDSPHKAPTRTLKPPVDLSPTEAAITPPESDNHTLDSLKTSAVQDDADKPIQNHMAEE